MIRENYIKQLAGEIAKLLPAPVVVAKLLECRDELNEPIRNALGYPKATAESETYRALENVLSQMIADNNTNPKHELCIPKVVPVSEMVLSVFEMYGVLTVETRINADVIVTANYNLLGNDFQLWNQ